MKIYRPNCEVNPEMEVPPDVKRQVLVVEYNGRAFRGFQKQASTKETVQAYLEKALSKVANEPVTLVCSGRTDAGVHASAQVIHFDTRAKRPEKAWVEGVNTQLPDQIRVLLHTQVPLSFHARFTAQARTYRYILYSHRIRPAVLGDYVTWVAHPLDVAAMNGAAKLLIGEHDFSSFRASQCQAVSPVRHIESIEVRKQGAFVILEVTANAFLYHMVRNIVGALLEVGRGAKPERWLEELLLLKDRNANAATAPPFGLFFVHVRYPDTYGVELPAPGPIFLGC